MTPSFRLVTGDIAASIPSRYGGAAQADVMEVTEMRVVEIDVFSIA
jgi:hypothetical protein